MAKFTDKETKHCVVIDAEVKYSYTAKSGKDEGKFSYDGVDLQVQDQQGNMYSISLGTKEISEADYLSKDSLVNILKALQLALEDVEKIKDKERTPYNRRFTIQGLLGRRADDFQ